MPGKAKTGNTGNAMGTLIWGHSNDDVLQVLYHPLCLGLASNRTGVQGSTPWFLTRG